MHVRIYRPAKTAMQSGRGKSNAWVLEFEPADRAEPDALMGWNGSADTRRQVELRFDGEAEAVAYARENGYTYTVQRPRERQVKPKAYTDNFAYSRLEPWTH
jgi:hypothetical protein